VLGDGRFIGPGTEGQMFGGAKSEGQHALVSQRPQFAGSDYTRLM